MLAGPHVGTYYSRHHKSQVYMNDHVSSDRCVNHILVYCIHNIHICPRCLWPSVGSVWFPYDPGLFINMCQMLLPEVFHVTSVCELTICHTCTCFTTCKCASGVCSEVKGSYCLHRSELPFLFDGGLGNLNLLLLSWLERPHFDNPASVQS